MPPVTSAILGFIQELVFPPRCPACSGFSRGFCDKCAAGVTPMEGPLFYCGAVSGAYAAFEYKGAAREAILNMKFRGRRDAARPLASSLFHAIPRGIIERVDVVAYIPSSKRRLEERGYNQARDIARRLAKLARKPLVDALSRDIESAPFYKLSPEERARALEGAFSVKGAKLTAGKAVLVADDVVTTGSTLNAAATELIKAGASEVFCAAVCAGVLRKNENS